MKTSIAIIALLGLIEAKHHHHHHVSLAQGVTNGKGNSNPKSNRGVFDKDVANAAAVVAEEKRSENERTSTHAAAMASQYKATYDKNAATRTKYNDENVMNNVLHNQWQVRTDRSDDNTGRWAQISDPATPDSNRALFDADVAKAAATVATEKSSEAGRTSTHAAAMASQYQATYDKNAATRTKYVHENVNNDVVHNQQSVRTDRSTDNLGRWAQISAPATPDSNRALFDADVKKAAATVATENSSEAGRTSTHKAAMASQYKATYDKNAATRTKYVHENVANNVVHNQWQVRTDRSDNNTGRWAQISSEDSIGNNGMDQAVHDFIIDKSPDDTTSRFAQVSAPATPDSNRDLFDADVKKAAATVATENSSEAGRTSTHAAAMASQYQATYDKNAATRTKYVHENVNNDVVHNQQSVRTDRSDNNTGRWAQVNAPGDRTINRTGLDPRVASLLTGGDEDSTEIRGEFALAQYDKVNNLWRLV